MSSGTAALNEPLLAQRKKGQRCLEEGSLGTSVILLTSAAVGTGVLALPYGVSIVGFLPALGLFAFAGYAAFISNEIIFDCVRTTGYGSYGQLMTQILGKRGAIVLDAFVVLEGLGAIATYLVFIMDFVPQVCVLAGEDAWCTDRRRVVLVASLIIWPLSCLKGMSSLRYASTCSLVTIIFTSIVVVAKAPGLFSSSGVTVVEAVTEAHFNISSFKVFSMACFAFMTHTNSPGIALSVRKKHQGRQVVAYHTVLLCSVYSAIAVCGYLSFMKTINQDFLTNYDVRDALIVICRCCLSSTLVLACPINLVPAMQALLHIADELRPTTGSTKHEPLYENDAVRVPVATCCFALALGFALKTPRVADLISMISAFLSSPLMFAFPAIMYWRILDKHDYGKPLLLLGLTAALWISELAPMLL